MGDSKTATKEATPLLSPQAPPSDRVDRHSIQGVAPGGIAAHSNHMTKDDSEHFQFNVEGGFRTGMKWQCVEFARRWLLHRKGLVLPDVYFAAHLFYLPYVYDASDLSRHVPCRGVRNGTPEKPEADSLIIYSTQFNSFPGHVGVITEVGDDFVRVADQNRYFHKWTGSYSMQFDLKHEKDGTWRIIDDHESVLGWVIFPGVPNREEGSLCKVQDGVTHPPEFDQKQHLKWFRESFKEVRTIMKVPYAIKFLGLTTLFMVAYPFIRWFKGKL